MDLNPTRVAWVDYAKGFCIVMVVMMHSTLGVEAAAGEQSWMGALVAFAKPFRMPDFFLISGLFLARVIGRPWRAYLDTKVIHFAYFYVLWVTIQFAFKAPGIAAEVSWGGVAQAYALAFIEPFGTLWFIYLVPIFFVVTKLMRDVPLVLLWFAAAFVQIADIHTGWIVIDVSAPASSISTRATCSRLACSTSPRPYSPISVRPCCSFPHGPCSKRSWCSAAIPNCPWSILVWVSWALSPWRRRGSCSPRALGRCPCAMRGRTRS
jgi:hypothetical protein